MFQVDENGVLHCAVCEERPEARIIVVLMEGTTDVSIYAFCMICKEVAHIGVADADTIHQVTKEKHDSDAECSPEH